MQTLCVDGNGPIGGNGGVALNMCGCDQLLQMDWRTLEADSTKTLASGGGVDGGCGALSRVLRKNKGLFMWILKAAGELSGVLTWREVARGRALTGENQ